MQNKLITKKQLGEIHPALANKWRLAWLVRMRRIPMVRVGKSIFFDAIEIEKWIEKNKIKPEVSRNEYK